MYDAHATTVSPRCENTSTGATFGGLYRANTPELTDAKSVVNSQNSYIFQEIGSVETVNTMNGSEMQFVFEELLPNQESSVGWGEETCHRFSG